MSRLALFVLLFVPLRAQTLATQYLFAAINQERGAHNLAPVLLDPALSRAATIHAEKMAGHGFISHQFSSEPELATRGSATGAHFSRITENVAEGSSILEMHDALMRSLGHRANILDRAVDSVGIAVVSRRGQLYAVEDFALTVAPLTFDEQEHTVLSLLARSGLELLPSASARHTCAQSRGYAGDELPIFVMRYTTADMSQLPDELTRRLRLGTEHRAAVGACTPPVTAFSQYSLAVLLFR